MFQGKNLAINGSHRCNGGILNFIIKAPINIKIIKLLNDRILLIIIENIIINEAIIWIIK